MALLILRSTIADSHGRASCFSKTQRNHNNCISVMSNQNFCFTTKSGSCGLEAVDLILTESIAYSCVIKKVFFFKEILRGFICFETAGYFFHIDCMKGKIFHVGAALT